jgi:hypothetical protein
MTVRFTKRPLPCLRMLENVGEKFFESLTEHLCDALGVDFAVVGMLRVDEEMVQFIAVHGPHGKVQPPSRFALSGTPCEEVLKHRARGYPDRVQLPN